MNDFRMRSDAALNLNSTAFPIHKYSDRCVERR